MNGSQAFGKPLSEAYTAPDGSTEQVYENVVLYSAPNQSDNVHLRPLAVIRGVAHHGARSTGLR